MDVNTKILVFAHSRYKAGSIVGSYCLLGYLDSKFQNFVKTRFGFGLCK